MDSGTQIAQGTQWEENNGSALSIFRLDLLPGELLTRILSRLPFSSLIRSRCVCKKWNELHFSSDYAFSVNVRSKCVPIHFFEGPLMVYSSGRKSWEQISLAFLGVPLDSLALLISAGGLLCFKNRDSGEFIICNPVTKQWKALQLPDGFDHKEIRPPEYVWAPDIKDLLEYTRSQNMANCSGFMREVEAYLKARGKDVIVAILPQNDNKSFKLLVAGISDESPKRRTLIFHSLTGRWSVGGDVPRGVQFWESGKTLYYNDYLYCVTWSVGIPKGQCDLEYPWSVVRYSVLDNNWSEYPLSSPGKILPQLVEHLGSGFVVQRLFDTEKVEISFAELREEGPMSVVMLKDWPLDLLPLKPDDANMNVTGDWCGGQGDCFYLALEHRNYIENQGLQVLIYDMTMDAWTKLPVLHDRSPASTNFLHIFEASVTASV